MFVCEPISIVLMSARTMVLNQTLDSVPMVARPMIVAVGAIYTDESICGENERYV